MVTARTKHGAIGEEENKWYVGYSLSTAYSLLHYSVDILGHAVASFCNNCVDVRHSRLNGPPTLIQTAVRHAAFAYTYQSSRSHEPQAVIEDI